MSMPVTGKRKLLIVDYSESSVRYLDSLLSGGQYQCEHAFESLEALALCKQTDYDLVISDVHMPMLDGIEFVSLLREYQGYKRTPVILLSADKSVLTKNYLSNDIYLNWRSKDALGGELNELICALIIKSKSAPSIEAS